ncbi:MAG: MCE family protein [Actinomycetales bacterium]|nr:MAG: MCE family protein [Actinomycetales bacterium]
MSRPSTRRGDLLAGVGYFVVIAALLAAAALVYNRTFISSVDVKLRTDEVGSSLQKGSDVKLRGVPVGRVSSIRSTEDGALLTLALSPEATKEIPTSTTARLLPKTLFGERYVDLQAPAVDGGPTVESGDAIAQDTSAGAAELQEVLDGLLPLLQSIQPEKLQATLSELATMLRGRGNDLGDTLQAWGTYLTKLQPSVPQLATDLDKLGKVADTYAAAAPDLLAALDDLTTTSATVVDERRTLTDVYERVIAAADTSRGFVSDNRQTIEVLSRDGRKALEAAAPYASEFPCLLRSMRQFIPTMDKNLGQGTDQPGIHVVLNVTEGMRPYQAGRDEPTFKASGSPSCPYVPSSVKAADKKARSAQASRASASDPESIAAPTYALEGSAVAATGLGQANSPAENQLIAELVAPSQKMSPQDFPAWGSLLLGPVLRGAEVSVR